MGSRIAPNLFAFIILTLCIAGCESRTLYQLQFMDADSRQPLIGVRGRADEEGCYFNERDLCVHNGHDLPPSNYEGVVPVRLIDNGDWSNSLRFEIRGYKALDVDADFVSLRYSTTKNPTPWPWQLRYIDVTDSFESDMQWYNDQFPLVPLNVPPNKIIQIPMYRLPTTAPATLPSRD